MICLGHIDYFGYTVYPTGLVLNKAGKIAKLSDNGRGYQMVRLMIDGKSKSKALHRLVAELFLANPAGYAEVNHKDGNKLNNNLENLEWCSRSQNIQHAYDLKLRSAQGENNSRCQTTESEVLHIAKLLTSGIKASKIRDLGYSYALVRAIKSRQNWGWLTKDFKW